MRVISVSCGMTKGRTARVYAGKQSRRIVPPASDQPAPVDPPAPPSDASVPATEPLEDEAAMKRRAIKTALSAVKVADCLICIDGLPAVATAFAWATEMARKLKQSITVRTPAGEPIGTIDKAFLTGTKAELAEARRAARSRMDFSPSTQVAGGLR
jgi:hypothetical protein